MSVIIWHWIQVKFNHRTVFLDKIENTIFYIEKSDKLPIANKAIQWTRQNVGVNDGDTDK